MIWTQNVNPFHSIAISALVASIPIVFIFWALIIKKMKGYLASLLTTIVAVLITFFAFGMPLKLSLLSIIHGALYGFFPICWIIIGAVFLYNVSVKSGQFDIIKSFMASITTDRRLQALLIAFSFGAFLEGAAGMGAPVAITSAMLVGMGFNPIYAAGICLIANTVPVAFGSAGVPIIIASQVSGISEMAISQMVGRTLPILALIIPFYLVILMAGFKKSLEVLPAILLSGVTFAVIQWSVSNYLGPTLPSLMAGFISIIFLMVLLKYWKPKSIWRFNDEPQQLPEMQVRYSTAEIIKAWSPFLIMTVMIVIWGFQPVKETLNSIGQIKFYIPGLQNSILNGDGSRLIIKPFDLNYLSNSGSAMMLSVFISLPLIGMSFKAGLKVYLSTLYQLRFTIITITSIVGFAFIANNSGISITIALALAGTGLLFPFFSPILGWLGVFMTGSDASSNALFCKLQRASSDAIGINPVVTVAANASGGVVGKMISPQSIAVGAAAIGLVGKESELFRFTLKHSFILLFIVCIITLLQAYVFKWMVPAYKILEESGSVQKPNTIAGFTYLIFLLVMLIIIALIVILLNRRSKIK
jgi:lactate permease